MPSCWAAKHAPGDHCRCAGLSVATGAYLPNSLPSLLKIVDDWAAGGGVSCSTNASWSPSSIAFIALKAFGRMP